MVLHLKRMVVWKASGSVVVLILRVPHRSVSCWIILPSAKTQDGVRKAGKRELFSQQGVFCKPPECFSNVKDCVGGKLEKKNNPVIVCPD